jgi:hypothetical protein
LYKAAPRESCPKRCYLVGTDSGLAKHAQTSNWDGTAFSLLASFGTDLSEIRGAARGGGRGSAVEVSDTEDVGAAALGVGVEEAWGAEWLTTISVATAITVTATVTASITVTTVTASIAVTAVTASIAIATTVTVAVTVSIAIATIITITITVTVALTIAVGRGRIGRIGVHRRDIRRVGIFTTLGNRIGRFLIRNRAVRSWGRQNGRKEAGSNGEELHCEEW